MKPDSAAAKDLERIVTNGCYKDSFIPDAQNGTQTKSALNGINVEEELKKMEQSLEVIDNNVHQGIVLTRIHYHLLREYFFLNKQNKTLGSL